MPRVDDPARTQSLIEVPQTYGASGCAPVPSAREVLEQCLVSLVPGLGAGPDPRLSQLFTTHSPRPSINYARKADLEAISGIGATKAQAIIDARPFATVADLNAVSGIGDALVSRLLESFTLIEPNASAPRPPINSATQSELEAVDGVSSAVAVAIIEARPLTSYAALDAVAGVGPTIASRLHERFSLEEPTVRLERELLLDGPQTDVSLVASYPLAADQPAAGPAEERIEGSVSRLDLLEYARLVGGTENATDDDGAN